MDPVHDLDLLGDLDAHVTSEPEPIDYALGIDEPMAIEDEAAANRILRAIGRLNREVARVRAVADDEVRRIQAWANDRTVGAETRRAWLERSLEGWMLGQPADVRTLNLPNGVLRRRPLKQRVLVLDESDQAVAEVAALVPSVVQTKQVVVKAAVTADLKPGPVIEGASAEPGYTIRQAVTADGELVPHVVFEVPIEGADSFGYTPR